MKQLTITHLIRSESLCGTTPPARRGLPAVVPAVLALAAAATLFGCGIGTSGTAATSAGTAVSVATGSTTVHGLNGHVHGGQQPIGGATIQLYGVPTTGYGNAATPLLTTTVTSSDGTGLANSNANSGNANNTFPLGFFTITNDYPCPTTDPGTAPYMVYIVATQGNPGNGPNPNSALMAALGDCYALQQGAATTSIDINELTTVASVWALQRFMTSYSAMSTSSTNLAGLVNAFATVNTLVNTSTGALQSPTNATLPVAEINTLADALAMCVSSTGGMSGDTTSCGDLFQYATPTSGTAPTDTIGAALDIALNPSPSANTLNICNMASQNAPFQPTLPCTVNTTPAPNFLIGINYTGTGAGISSPNALAIDASGNVWVSNGGNGTVSELSNAGTYIPPASYNGGVLNGPSGIAIDPSGHVWVANKTGNNVAELTSGGAPVGQFTGDGVSAPTGVAVDGLGNVWLSNSGNSSVSEFNSSGSYIANYAPDAGISAPTGIAINAH